VFLSFIFDLLCKRFSSPPCIGSAIGCYIIYSWAKACFEQRPKKRDPTRSVESHQPAWPPAPARALHLPGRSRRAAAVALTGARNPGRSEQLVELAASCRRAAGRTGFHEAAAAYCKRNKLTAGRTMGPQPAMTGGTARGRQRPSPHLVITRAEEGSSAPLIWRSILEVHQHKKHQRCVSRAMQYKG
jgi:hypothetical protein